MAAAGLEYFMSAPFLVSQVVVQLSLTLKFFEITFFRGIFARNMEMVFSPPHGENPFFAFAGAKPDVRGIGVDLGGAMAGVLEQKNPPQFGFDRDLEVRKGGLTVFGDVIQVRQRREKSLTATGIDLGVGAILVVSVEVDVKELFTFIA